MTTARYAIADVAALLGEPSRAAILIALLDGRAIPAGVLAGEANLSAAATSLHLAKLMQGGLIAVRQEGRHRYYRLASQDVARAIEALGVLATAPPPARSLSPERAALREARTCYDHLAGALGVAFTTMLERDRIIERTGERTCAVTAHGTRWFHEAIDIDIAALARGSRPLARSCLDWTERRPHLAGAVGAAVLHRFLERRWLTCITGSRALRITPSGGKALREFGLRLPNDLT